MGYLDCPKPFIDEDDYIRNKDIQYINTIDKKKFTEWKREKSYGE